MNQELDKKLTVTFPVTESEGNISIENINRDLITANIHFPLGQGLSLALKCPDPVLCVGVWFE